MAQRKPRVFTIPASAPFLATLIDALVHDRLGLNFQTSGDPLKLATVTLYLPTRRACRLARDAFRRTIGADAAILPRIVPIGDVDADEIAFAEAAAGEISERALDLKDALGGLERRMVLAELILKWAEQLKPHEPGRAPLVANNPALALMLATDLARLMDDMTTRQVSWDKLNSLVPADMDVHWELSFAFLKFVRERWPAILDGLDRCEVAERRDQLIEAEQARLATIAGPVIAAGSTGSMPATAALLDTIAKLPQGAVVLPGLDTDLDDASWQAIAGDDPEMAHGHPQFAMHALLRRIGVTRDAVTALAAPAAHGSERLVSEALRPAARSELWQTRLGAPDFAAHADAALRDMIVVEAANAEEEALAIAIALRQAMETPDKTAALVTPDRALARRVLAALSRWHVPADDSGGEALTDAPLGAFARLLADAAFDGLAPVKLLALLKHPLCGADPWAVAALEHAILRGPRPKTGTEGLRQALARFRIEYAKSQHREPSALHRTDPRIRMKEGELDAAQALVEQLSAALAPLEALTGRQSLAAIAERHRDAVTALLDPKHAEATSAQADQLDVIFDAIVERGRLAVRPSDYPEIFQAALADGGVVRPPERDVRVRIYGPLEARLQNVDLMVLGGLTEGVWPPETRADPWLSRPMRQALGLDLPERRIGLSAHDFAQALGAPEVMLTRAARVAGAPTVASRFVQRLAAVAGEARWSAAVARGEQYLGWARALDKPDSAPKPIARPEPRPPREARPKQLNVTDIETLLRDPYSIYARYVLRLRPLDAVDTPLGARDRGTVIHNAIGDFTKAHADRLPDDIEGELLKLGEHFFAPLQDFPDARAFWWPRFQRIARWFVRFEEDRRAKLRKLHAEISGTLEIPLREGVFTLRSRADRIEELTDGRFAILDYKTGRPPSAKQVQTGLSPQLTLEGAILQAGKFGDIPAGGSIAEIAYVAIRGGEPPGELTLIDWKNTTPDQEASRALAKLTGVITAFDDPESPYLSKERPMFIRRFPGDYDHLARVKEWSLSGGAEEDEGASE